MHRFSLIASLAVVISLSAELAVAQTPVGYRGRLEDAATGPITGDYDFIFTLWSDPTSTDSGQFQVWTEVQNRVPVINGSFAVHLGASNSIADREWSDYPTLYLEIAVRPFGTTPWVPMQNRQQMMHAPMAIRARNLQVCVARTASVSPNTGNTFTAQANCLAGEIAIAGGHRTNVTPSGVDFNSYPVSGLTGWVTSGYNGHGTAVTVTSYAICCP